MKMLLSAVNFIWLSLLFKEYHARFLEKAIEKKIKRFLTTTNLKNKPYQAKDSLMDPNIS